MCNCTPIYSSGLLRGYYAGKRIGATAAAGEVHDVFKAVVLCEPSRQMEDSLTSIFALTFELIIDYVPQYFHERRTATSSILSNPLLLNDLREMHYNHNERCTAYSFLYYNQHSTLIPHRKCARSRRAVVKIPCHARIRLETPMSRRKYVLRY